MATVDDFTVSAATERTLLELGFSRVSVCTWSATAEDVMIFVSLQPSDYRVNGHLTRKNMVGPHDKPYSQTWTAQYASNRDTAVEFCARHMLEMAEEHLLTGAIKFQRYGSAPEEYTVIANYA